MEDRIAGGLGRRLESATATATATATALPSGARNLPTHHHRLASLAPSTEQALLASRLLAHQGLLDDFDVGVLNLDFEILEVGHDEAGIGVAEATCARRPATIAHAALAREDAALEAIPATVGGAAVTHEQQAKVANGARNLAQPEGSRGTDVAHGQRSAMQLDEAQVFTAALVAHGAAGAARNRPKLGPFRVAGPAAASAKLGHHGAAAPAGNGRAFNDDAHPM